MPQNEPPPPFLAPGHAAGFGVQNRSEPLPTVCTLFCVQMQAEPLTHYVVPPMRQLRIKLRNSEVPRSDKQGAADPYFVVKCGLYRAETEPQFDNTKPVWDEDFIIPVPYQVAGVSALPKEVQCPGAALSNPRSFFLGRALAQSLSCQPLCPFFPPGPCHTLPPFAPPVPLPPPLSPSHPCPPRCLCALSPTWPLLVPFPLSPPVTSLELVGWYAG